MIEGRPRPKDEAVRGEGGLVVEASLAGQVIARSERTVVVEALTISRPRRMLTKGFCNARG
jgi:hypothetical protein